MTIELIHGDCEIELDNVADKSVNLIVIDPPYNIGKDTWDKWKKKQDYIDFMGRVFLKLQAKLKDNGSFYFFHNDMEQIADLMLWIRNNTRFVFKQFIPDNHLLEYKPRIISNP